MSPQHNSSNCYTHIEVEFTRSCMRDWFLPRCATHETSALHGFIKIGIWTSSGHPCCCDSLYVKARQIHKLDTLFLSYRKIWKSQFQILGSTLLLLGSYWLHVPSNSVGWDTQSPMHRHQYTGTDTQALFCIPSAVELSALQSCLCLLIP